MDEATRRDLVREGVRFGGLALAATGAPLLMGADGAQARPGGDAEILAAAARLELTAVFVYDTAGKRGQLPARMHEAAKLMRDQDEAHAGTLIAALRTLGVERPPTPTSIDQVAGLAAALAGGPKTTLEFITALVESIVAVYYRGQRKLRDAKLLQTTATIMCNQGQHLVILRKALRRDPVPHPFETGGA